MADEGDQQTERVSLDKSSGATSAPAPSVSPATASPRPRQIVWVVAAVVVSGVAGMIASLTLFGLHHFLLHQATIANNKLTGKDHKSVAQVAHNVSVLPRVSTIQSALYLVVLLFVARAVWRGRYWSRWAVIGVLVLATFTGINGSLLQLTTIATDLPVAYKLPSFLASLALVFAAVVVGGVRPVSAWLNESRPARPVPGDAPVRRGLFGAPRVPMASSPTEAPLPETPAAGAVPERPRSKQRVTSDAVANGADLARARAKASKSRRTFS